MIMFCESCKRPKKSEWMHNEKLCLDCLYSKPEFGVVEEPVCKAGPDAQQGELFK